LKTIELPIQPDNPSMEVIPKQDNLFMKLIDMTQNAKRQIETITSLENLKYAYINYSKNLKERLRKTIKMRIITESHEPDAFTEEIILYSQASNNRIELRQVEKLPFNLLIVDDNEAIWGELQTKNENPQNLWTNDPTQIAILKMSFENLWQKSSSIRKLHD